MNSLILEWMKDLEDLLTVPKGTHSDSNDLSALAPAALRARIEWCRKLERQVGTQSESEGWYAEEEGLRDALLNRDRSLEYRYSPSGVLERYTTGLEDGRTLIRAARVEWDWHQSAV
jgi:hypothetical protein